MKTLVYQSYRSTGVPAWISACMRSVQAWASDRQYGYRLFDDSFFDFAPPWYRRKVEQQICPVTDLARLVAARELLSQGWEQVIWVDADMLVFAPERLDIQVSGGFLFAHELWISHAAGGAGVPIQRVNNSVAAFTRDNVHLDFFIDAAQRIAERRDRVGKLDVGTAFLTGLRTILPFPLLMNVGMFSPALVAALADGDEGQLQAYARHLQQPLACANFCGSLVGVTTQGVRADDQRYAAAVTACLQTRGTAINRFIGPTAAMAATPATSGTARPATAR